MPFLLHSTIEPVDRQKALKLIYCGYGSPQNTVFETTGKTTNALDAINFNPPRGVIYFEMTFATGMKNLAGIARMSDVETVTIAIDGSDTHCDQGACRGAPGGEAVHDSGGPRRRATFYDDMKDET
ncbi:MAG: hypothetical protein ACI8X5_003996, partial [Planctomycetota bacterium]